MHFSPQDSSEPGGTEESHISCIGNTVTMIMNLHLAQEHSVPAENKDNVLQRIEAS
jgi:hypothetical protein